MERLAITLPEQDDRINTHLPEPDMKNFNKLKEEYGFGSSAEAARTFLKLGMMSIVDNDPRHSVSKADSGGFDPVTIREVVPEGEENAVEVTEEFWDEVLRNQMLDIVEEDPEIHRSGLQIYR
jgi:hypothetical protein